MTAEFSACCDSYLGYFNCACSKQQGTKMEASAVCALQSAESDAKNNTSEQKSDEELLEGLLTDYYCHICSSNLMFESNRVAHYEGKQHSQRVKTYLNAMRADLGRGCQNTSRDRNRFCELCYVVFSSHVVAKSHYEGKIHAKNLRKRSLLMPVQPQINLNFCRPDPTPTSNNPALSNTGVDLKDPNKYCALCVASFNNPQMALQHYNGRKHQKKMAREELLKAHGNDAQQGTARQRVYVTIHKIYPTLNKLILMYQAHMQGNKHQIREKKLRILFKSQPKVYSTFADELADYIQVQKVRGITPKTSELLPEENTQNDDDYEEEEEVQHKDQCDLTAAPVFLPNFPQISHLPPQPYPGPRFAFTPAPSWPPIGRPYSFPPAHPSSTQFTGWPTDTGRQSRLSTSSTCTTSSSSSRHSSDGSESDECENRNPEKRRAKRHREDEESGAAESRTKRQRMERSYDSEDRRREQFGESGEERSGKKLKAHRRQTRKQKACQQEDFEADQEGSTSDRSRSQAKTSAEPSESGHSKSAKPRKEKKKAKEVVDTRTEEEKLWDDSILGC
uniref:Lysine-rich coiled-coil protein 1 n=1 Tax=Poecilia latipinna TaxID=48699 RepID=A0A3B3VJE9_9TELE